MVSWCIKNGVKFKQIWLSLPETTSRTNEPRNGFGDETLPSLPMLLQVWSSDSPPTRTLLGNSLPEMSNKGNNVIMSHVHHPRLSSPWTEYRCIKYKTILDHFDCTKVLPSQSCSRFRHRPVSISLWCHQTLAPKGKCIVSPGLARSPRDWMLLIASSESNTKIQQKKRKNM